MRNLSLRLQRSKVVQFSRRPKRMLKGWDSLCVVFFVLSRHKVRCADARLFDQVIYGDTDSVMIDTRVTDYDVAIKIANEFKKVINAKYRKLEIDTDAVFSRMLLQQKKKYAALKYEKGGKLVREVKGLDQKRREFSLIAKEVLSYAPFLRSDAIVVAFGTHATFVD